MECREQRRALARPPSKQWRRAHCATNIGAGQRRRCRRRRRRRLTACRRRRLPLVLVAALRAKTPAAAFRLARQN